MKYLISTDQDEIFINDDMEFRRVKPRIGHGMPHELRDRCHGHPDFAPYSGQHDWHRTTFRIDQHMCGSCGAAKILFTDKVGTALRPAIPTLAPGYRMTREWPGIRYYRKV